MAYATKSVQFNDNSDGGSGEIAAVANNTLLSKERTDKFSISWWMAYAKTGGYAFGKRGVNPEYRGWVVSLETTSTLRFTVCNDSAGSNYFAVDIGTGSPLTNRWHHYVLTFDGSSSALGVKAYIDGTEVTPSVVYNNLTATIVNTGTFWIGGGVATTAGWCGNSTQTQFAIYDRVLTQAEVTWLYNSGSPRDLLGAGAPTDPEAWWKLGLGDTYPTLLNASGRVAFPSFPDRSGSGYNGTAANMESTDVVLDSPGGVHSTKCLVFDGVNELVTIGNVLSFERTNPFSFSFWFKCAAPGTYYVPLSKMGVSLVGYQVSIDSSGRIELWLVSNLGGGNYIEVRTVSGYADSAWHHCTISFSGSSLASGVTIYIDGSSVSTTVVVDALTGTIVNTNNFILAGRDDGFYFYAGRLDEVTVYNRELTASEVTWVYNGGVPRDPRIAGGPSGLVAWWPLGEGTGTPVGNLTMTNMESTDILNDGPDFWYEQVGADQDAYLQNEDGHGQIVVVGGGGGAVTTYYKMRAIDDGAAPPGYVTWVATTPDFAGAGFSGGTPTPVGSMVPGSAVVAAHWEEVA